MHRQRLDHPRRYGLPKLSWGLRRAGAPSAPRAPPRRSGKRREGTGAEGTWAWSCHLRRPTRLMVSVPSWHAKGRKRVPLHPHESFLFGRQVSLSLRRTVSPPPPPDHSGSASAYLEGSSVRTCDGRGHPSRTAPSRGFCHRRRCWLRKVGRAGNPLEAPARCRNLVEGVRACGLDEARLGLRPWRLQACPVHARCRIRQGEVRACLGGRGSERSQPPESRGLRVLYCFGVPLPVAS